MDGASTERPAPDQVLIEIADYVLGTAVDAREARETARHCLMDALGCAALALKHDACANLLGPVIPDIAVPVGSTVPGTDSILDPVTAAFNIGCMIRWLDYNDTWLAAEWGHPSDNLGGVLAAADYVSRRNLQEQKPALKVRDILTALIKAYEVQGVIALQTAFNRAGIDHVILVRVATAAVVTGLLGGTRQQILSAVSNAWADGGSLRVYRQAPNTGSRKSWAAGDATSRGVWLALLALKDEMGYPSVLTAKTWGLNDAILHSQPVKLGRPLGTYVVENILFKIDFPAEFHAQTAVECALRLHPTVKNRVDQIRKITVWTQQSAMRIIDKQGPLHSYADRDHCLRYMVAVPLIHGRLTADDYGDEAAKDPRIDRVRSKIELVEEPRFTKDYLDPEKRSISNAVQIEFTDGSMSEKVIVEFPAGHRRRRTEGLPRLQAKFRSNLAAVFSPKEVDHLAALFDDSQRLEEMPVDQFMDLLCPKT